MPDCPHCHEYYFGHPDTCPKCHYNFTTHRIEKPASMLTAAERANNQRAEQENLLAQQRDNLRTDALRKNPRYEYETVFLRDNSSGGLNEQLFSDTLNKYALEGWRLHTVFTNESGKNSRSMTIGGNTFGTNATMDTTVMVFERCIKIPEY